VSEEHHIPAQPAPDYPEEPQPDDQEQVRERFARVRRNLWFTLTFALNSAAAWIGSLFADGALRVGLWITGAAFAIAAIGFHQINWRCPSCTRRVPLNVGDECPHCGAQLKPAPPGE
jgi:hypothetical protein